MTNKKKVGKKTFITIEQHEASMIKREPDARRGSKEDKHEEKGEDD